MCSLVWAIVVTEHHHFCIFFFNPNFIAIITCHLNSGFVSVINNLCDCAISNANGEHHCWFKTILSLWMYTFVGFSIGYYYCDLNVNSYLLEFISCPLGFYLHCKMFSFMHLNRICQFKVM